MKPCHRCLVLAVVLMFFAGLSPCKPTAAGLYGKSPLETPTTAGSPRSLARLRIQDLQTRSLRRADLKVDDADELTLGDLVTVEEFKRLDPAEPKLVQIADHAGIIVALGSMETND
ncbi:MAG: hypothetical protein NZO58_08300 [Gemmataceae bacterium]|nr:hypothetical protein [Gemmataceae bacterium]